MRLVMKCLHVAPKSKTFSLSSHRLDGCFVFVRGSVKFSGAAVAAPTAAAIKE